MKKYTSYVSTEDFPEGFRLKTFKTAKKAKNYLRTHKDTVTEIHKEVDTKSKEILSVYYRKKGCKRFFDWSF